MHLMIIRPRRSPWRRASYLPGIDRALAGATALPSAPRKGTGRFSFVFYSDKILPETPLEPPQRAQTKTPTAPRQVFFRWTVSSLQATTIPRPPSETGLVGPIYYS